MYPGCYTARSVTPCKSCARLNYTVRQRNEEIALHATNTCVGANSFDGISQRGNPADVGFDAPSCFRERDYRTHRGATSFLAIQVLQVEIDSDTYRSELRVSLGWRVLGRRIPTFLSGHHDPEYSVLVSGFRLRRSSRHAPY